MSGDVSSKTILVFPADVIEHVLKDHVHASAQESWESDKGVFNLNWLETIHPGEPAAAIGKVATFVFEKGDSGPTSGAATPEIYDYYLNFDQKTGWQTIDEMENIRWYKGVVVRGQLKLLTFTVSTMFPRGWL